MGFDSLLPSLGYASQAAIYALRPLSSRRPPSPFFPPPSQLHLELLADHPGQRPLLRLVKDRLAAPAFLAFQHAFVLPTSRSRAIAIDRALMPASRADDTLPMARLPRFRFHLSTAIVLVLVAGVLLGLNMRPGPCGWFYGFPYTAVSTAVLNSRVSEAYADQCLFDSSNQDCGPMPCSVRAREHLPAVISLPLVAQDSCAEAL
jgi:hypothetical protein